MAQTVPSKCPLCSGQTEVTEISCLECGVQIRGHFLLAAFEQLDAEQMKLLETFLRCRGVIRDMEAALGLSYPTVRGRLDALLAALGFADGATPAPVPAVSSDEKAARRKEILAAIDAGTMDAGSGLRALESL